MPAFSMTFSVMECPLQRSQFFLWGSPFFFCIPSCISGIHHSSSSAFQAVSLGFTILLLLHFHLYLWGSPFFFCVPSCISGIHHSSSSAFPAVYLGFTILLLQRSQLYLWGSPFWVRFCVCDYPPPPSVSQGRICSDNFTCCHTEIEVADQMFYLTQSQYTDTGPTSPSADPITPGAWQGSHWSAKF